MTDPVFREAVDKGLVPQDVDNPTLSQAQSAAGKVRAEYLLAVDMVKGEGEVLGAAFLYRNGRQIWKDPDINYGPMLGHLRDRLKKKDLTQEQFDLSVLRLKMRGISVQLGSQFGEEDTARSMARSWTQMISTGPLAGLPKQPHVETPEPDQGQVPSNIGASPKIGDDAKWRTEFQDALKVGDSSRAVAIVRDAIDASPMDAERRLALVKLLRRSGEYVIAAGEARRAAELLPEHGEFRALAARCWIQSGNHDEAQIDLNEAIARSPESAETRQLLGEVAIANGEYETAIEHLDKAVAAGNSGDAYYLRSIARAMLGDIEKAVADTQQANAAGLSTDPDESEMRYALVATIFDEGVTAIGGDIRTLQQKAQVMRTEKAVRDEYAAVLKKVSGRETFISALPVPAGHETSHGRRVLAYKLLSQCLADLDLFLRKGSEDILTESRINLGEALKQIASARINFKDEQQGKKSDGKPG
jgi:tetratricopeptide (TPR) repeat protein